VLSNIPQIKVMEDKVKKAIGSKQKQAEKLNNELVALDKTLRDPNVANDAKAKAQREFQLKKTELDIKVSEIREEQAKIVQKEEKIISDKISKAVETVAKAKGITIVIHDQAVVYKTDDSLDISKEVVDIVSKSK
jgi:Skp family chaperone for outer membrane proteins